MKRKNIRVLGLIPARGGSKGIPQKNIKLLRPSNGIGPEYFKKLINNAYI